MVSHAFTQDLSNQFVFDTGIKLRDFDLRYYLQYSLKDATTIGTLYKLAYHPNCWAVILTLLQANNPRDTTFKISFELSGLTGREF
jgi:hypothetical protein